MQNDDITWSNLLKGHCSYRFTAATDKFCRNEYNVTGQCNRKSCPLANSQYATVREHKGQVYLYMRRSERVFTPCKQWERVKLSKEFIPAMQQIEDNLVFWGQNNYFQRKCKRRFLRIRESLSRMRTMKLHVTKEIVPYRRKREMLLNKKEQKALKAAKLEDNIQKALLKRLEAGAYGKMYDFEKQRQEKALREDIRREEKEDRMLEDSEEEEEEEEEEELEEETETAERTRLGEEEDEEIDPYVLAELEREVEEEGFDEDDFSASDEETMEGDEEEDEEAASGDDRRVEFVEDFSESEDEDGLGDIEDADRFAPVADKSQKTRMPGMTSLANVIPAHQRLQGNKTEFDMDDHIKKQKYGELGPKRKIDRLRQKQSAARKNIKYIYEKKKKAKEERAKAARVTKQR